MHFDLDAFNRQRSFMRSKFSSDDRTIVHRAIKCQFYCNWKIEVRAYIVKWKSTSGSFPPGNTKFGISTKNVGIWASFQIFVQKKNENIDDMKSRVRIGIKTIRARTQKIKLSIAQCTTYAIWLDQLVLIWNKRDNEFTVRMRCECEYTDDAVCCGDLSVIHTLV